MNPSTLVKDLPGWPSLRVAAQTALMSLRIRTAADLAKTLNGNTPAILAGMPAVLAEIRRFADQAGVDSPPTPALFSPEEADSLVHAIGKDHPLAQKIRAATTKDQHNAVT